MRVTNQVNWDLIINGLDTSTINDFARGELSGEDFYQESMWSQGVSPEVRRLLRNRGVQEARTLARKALRRRGVRV